jgi:hypothetical protein
MVKSYHWIQQAASRILPCNSHVRPSPTRSKPLTVSPHALLPAAASSPIAGESIADAEQIGILVERSDRANAALMKGDADGYRALIGHTCDYTLMAPFGGPPTRQAELDEARWQSVGRFFRNGTFAQELVQAYGGRDMAALVTIERPFVEVGGLAAQPWALRVTQVYCRDGSGWRLAHRHADPLHHGISLDEAAALGRGGHLKPL